MRSAAVALVAAACGSGAPPERVAPIQPVVAPIDAAVASPDATVAPSVFRTIDGVKVLETYTGGAVEGDHVPLVVALHPQGLDPTDFAALAEGFTERAHLVLPYADPANGELSWYRGESTDPGAPGVRVAAARVAAVIRTLASAPAVAGKPIVIGYSQGAIIALALAVTETPRLAAVISIAGRLPPALFPIAARIPASVARPSVDEFHGDADRAVPYAAARSSIEALAADQFSARLHTYPGVGHQIVADEAATALATLAGAVAREAAPPTDR